MSEVDENTDLPQHVIDDIWQYCETIHMKETNYEAGSNESIRVGNVLISRAAFLSYLNKTTINVPEEYYEKLWASNGDFE